MIDLILSREIYSPIERTYAYHAALESAVEYWPNLLDCRKVEGSYGTAVVGDRYRWRYRLKGHEIAGLLEVDEVVAGQRLVFHTSGGMQARFQWEYLSTAHTRTRMTMRLSYAIHDSLPGRLLDRIRIEHAVTEDMSAAMDRLRDVLEEGLVEKPSRKERVAPGSVLSGFSSAGTPEIEGEVVLQLHTAGGEISYCNGPDATGRCPDVVAGRPMPCRAGAITPLRGTLVDGWRIAVPPRDELCALCPLARVLDPAARGRADQRPLGDGA